MMRWLPRLMVTVPWLSLALALLAWLRYGIDMPWYDDWRTYDGGWAGSLAPRHLFQAINYTLSPVGIALDALAQRLLDGNAVAYQFLSMLGVLGGLLLLQWRLLRAALDDARLVAVCFLCTLFMLQPGSYWGLENLAYHQALPLLFVLAALWLVLQPAAPPPHWRGPVLAALALLAGFSYISGAFGALAAGLMLALLGGLRRGTPQGARLLRDAAWFTAGAALATGAQFVFSFLVYEGSSGAVPMALPHQGAFWWYALGKVGRSLLLPAQWPLVAMGVTLAAIGLALGMAWWLLRRMARQGADSCEQRVAVVLLPLAAMALMYLGMVTAGRAGLRPADVQGPLQVFGHGFVRFHFFWLTLLWPWLAAALWLALRGRIRWPQWSGPLAALLLVAAVAMAGGFAHGKYQRERAVDRAMMLQCLHQELQKDAPIRCLGLLPPNRSDPAPDAWPAYRYASGIGASFVRQVPMWPGTPRLAGQQGLFDLVGRVGLLELQQLRPAEGGSFDVLGDDPQLFLNLIPREAAAACRMLDVVMRVQVTQPGLARLYWGDPAFVGPFNETVSQVRGLRGGSPETVAFRIASPRGFFHSLRLDPVEGRQPLRIESLRVVCVSAREPAPAGR
jgi:hypothetical protein